MQHAFEYQELMGKDGPGTDQAVSLGVRFILLQITV